MDTITGPKSPSSRQAQFLSELLKELDDPICQRLIRAYDGTNPAQSMEEELGRILLEVVNRED